MTGPSGSLPNCESNATNNRVPDAEADRLREEIKFLEEPINGLKGRMGSAGNAVQSHNLDMLSRLRDRCNRSLAALEKRGAAA